MSWPTPQEYNEAIQHPSSAFDNIELKSGLPELWLGGIPRPITGSFASVYRLKCGLVDRAVRCFLQEVKDQQERYVAISQHLTSAKLSYTVGFEYLIKGIHVQRPWYPILEMEWIHGESLIAHIQSHLRDSASLRQLAIRWLAMMKALQGASIAHGDLQHGNILIVNGDFRLIDYDGMYVPALAGRSSNELGHRNYQHPLRRALDFGPELDNFSSWVIYLALVVAAIDAALWTQLNAGDLDALIFHKPDFDKPDQSKALQLLEGHSNPYLRMLAMSFRSTLSLPVRQVPGLDGQSPPVTTPMTIQAGSGASWVSDHLGTSQNPGPATRSQPTAPSMQSQTWVLDYMTQSGAITFHRFHQSFVIPRGLAFLSINTLLFLIVAAILVQPALSLQIFGSDVLVTLFYGLVGALVVGTLLILNGLVLTMKYQGDTRVREKKAIVAGLNKERLALTKLQNQMSANEAKKTALRVAISKKKAEENATLIHLKKQELDEIELINTNLKKSSASINARLNAFNQSEQRGLNALQPIRLKISGLNDQIRSLTQTESTEMAKELQSIQTQFVDNHLRSASVLEAHVRGYLTGIGPKRSVDLTSNGMLTAYDVTLSRVGRVSGFGPTRTQTVMAWRYAVEGEAKATMPSDLSPAIKNTIRGKYAATRQDLEARRDREQVQLTSEENSIRERYNSERRPLIQEQAAAQLQSEQQRQEVNKRYAQQYIVPTQAIAQLEKEVAEKDRLINVQTMALKNEIFACNWRMAKIDHELTAYQNIRFNSFLRSAFF
jgi:hypothetical protein